MSSSPSQAEAQRTVETDPTKEYLAGGLIASFFNRALPAASDDVGIALGLQTYERMQHDPDVWAALLLLKILVLADGVQLQPAVAKPDPAKSASPDYQQAMSRYTRAAEIADFCKRAISAMKPGIRSVFEEKLDALVYGNKISEVTLRDGTGVDRGMLVFGSIKAKHYSAVQFVVDKFWNLLGFLPMFSSVDSGREVLPPEKFFYLSLHSQNNDPRGRSSLRSAFDPYTFKQNLWPTYDKWLKLCAIHKLIAKVKNGGKLEQVTDASGQPLMENGRPKTIPRSRAVLNALLQMENATAAVVDAEDDVEAYETQGTGEQFDRGFTVAGKQITKALLLQELATLDAKHQTKGSTGKQSEYVDLIVWYLKNRLIEEFRAQPLTLLVQANYGDDGLEFLPNLSMGDNELTDYTEGTTGLERIGAWLTDSMFLQQTDRLSIKRPDEGEVLPPRIKSQPAAQKSNQGQDNAQAL
jgi:hypothetical protein